MMLITSYKRARLTAICKAWPNANSLSDCFRLYCALLEFPMTNNEISLYLGCNNPSSKIAQLRRDGVHIVTHWDNRTTELGELRRFALYVLGDKGAHDTKGRRAH